MKKRADTFAQMESSLFKSTLNKLDVKKLNIDKKLLILYSQLFFLRIRTLSEYSKEIVVVIIMIILLVLMLQMLQLILFIF